MNDNEIPSTAGSLSTPLAGQLKQALQGARELLEPHAGHLHSALLSDLDALQEQFSDQHVRIAVCGEVKAGKSTLLNAIAGADLSPVAFEPLTNVALRVTHGPSTCWRMGTRVVGDLADIAREMRNGANDVAEVVVETNLDLLQLGGQVELLDTPGIGSDARMDTVSADTLRGLDAIILVVRYPALFTEYTRQLASRLNQDISKLFVVWNLDASCRGLSDEERSRHADTLRTNLAGAHDVFFVDAQSACDNRGADPDNSGLWYLTTALRNFLGSTSRELVALREAAKRAQQHLSSAQESLATRESMVGEVIRAARRHLEEIEAKANADIDAARSRVIDFETAMGTCVARSKGAAAQAATALRKALRQARRGWMWSGNLGELERNVGSALEKYADTVAQASSVALGEIRSGCDNLGASFHGEARPVTIPYVTELAPGGRGTLAAMGNWQLVRRTLWRDWYLEGLQRLDREVIADDLNQQAQWLDATRDAGAQAAQAALDREIERLKAQAADTSAQIWEETQLDAYEGEAQQLGRDLPAVEAQAASIADLAKRARGEM